MTVENSSGLAHESSLRIHPQLVRYSCSPEETVYFNVSFHLVHLHADLSQSEGAIEVFRFPRDFHVASCRGRA